MPKIEGDEVEYLYDPDYDPGQDVDEDNEAAGDDPCPVPPGAFIALTTNSRFQVKMGIPRHLVASVGIDQVARELAEDMDGIMNLTVNGPDCSPELGVQIDREKIRAALEAGISRT